LINANATKTLIDANGSVLDSVRDNMNMKYISSCILVLVLLIACDKTPEFHIIHFSHGTTEIVEADSALLYENLETLQDNTNVDVELAGYTDTIGSDSENMVLSQARADIIKSWLVQHGIASSRLTAVGYGESSPIGDTRTTEGRALNNRVEFAVE
jgi:OOP family OmpA-OmpF porin